MVNKLFIFNILYFFRDFTLKELSNLAIFRVNKLNKLSKILATKDKIFIKLKEFTHWILQINIKVFSKNIVWVISLRFYMSLDTSLIV